MPLYENFPYTNFHELNLDWLVEKVASLEAAFPEGTIGISKGGTGADNAAQARENLGIIAPNIPVAEGSTSTLDQEISRLEDNINSLAGDIKYRIFRVVTDLGLTSGTATLSSCWAAMSIGDILIAPPSEFAPGQVPENSGSVVLVRDAGHLVAAGEHGGPVIDVFASVGDDDRKAGGARGRVDADDLLFRSRHESEGVGVPKVRFLGEGEVLKVLDGGDSGNARFFKLFAVEAAGVAERLDLVVDLF